MSLAPIFPQVESANGELRVSDHAALKRTEVESARNITPDSYAFKPSSVKRYGAKGNGTDDTDAFQLAIDVARYETGGSGIVYVPEPDSYYRIDGTLDCTFATGNGQRGIRFIGQGSSGQDSPQTIVLSHTGGHGFDMTGCDSFSFENMSIGSDPANQPETCFFLARNSTAGSIFPRFHNARVNGYFSKAVLYNFAAEDGIYTACQWYNYSTAANTAVVWLTSTNIAALTSTFTSVYSGPGITCTDHEFFGGQFVNLSTDAEADVFKLDAITGLKMYGQWMHAGNPQVGSGRAYFFVDTANGLSGRIVLNGIKGEDAAIYSKYGIYFGDAPATCSEWAINNCYLPNTTNPIFAHEDVILDKFDIHQLTQQAGHALLAPGRVQYSTIDAGISLGLIIGTSKENHLIGDRGNWTITNREKDSWHDTGSSASTWTATTGGVTVSGTITTNRGLIAYHGKLVTATVYLVASTSISSGAGGSIAGLPIPALDYSAHVLVSDPNTNLSLGTGHIQGSTIYLPAISARTAIVVTATYFAA